MLIIHIDKQAIDEIYSGFFYNNGRYYQFRVSPYFIYTKKLDMYFPKDSHDSFLAFVTPDDRELPSFEPIPIQTLTFEELEKITPFS